MPENFAKRYPFTLSLEEKARLERLAPLFHIDFRVSDCGQITLALRNPYRDSTEVFVDSEHAHIRLLAEVCSRAVNWVYFHVGEPAHISLFSLTDARLARIAELYTKSISPTQTEPARV